MTRPPPRSAARRAPPAGRRAAPTRLASCVVTSPADAPHSSPHPHPPQPCTAPERDRGHAPARRPPLPPTSPPAPAPRLRGKGAERAGRALGAVPASRLRSSRRRSWGHTHTRLPRQGRERDAARGRACARSGGGGGPLSDGGARCAHARAAARRRRRGLSVGAACVSVPPVCGACAVRVRRRRWRRARGRAAPPAFIPPPPLTRHGSGRGVPCSRPRARLEEEEDDGQASAACGLGPAACLPARRPLLDAKPLPLRGRTPPSPCSPLRTLSPGGALGAAPGLDECGRRWRPRRSSTTWTPPEGSWR